MKGSGKTAFAIAATLGLLGLPAIGAAQTCGATSSIAIAKTGDLDFGTLGTSASAGTATINPSTGARTVTGGVIDLGGSFVSAGFAVLLCGAAGPKRFDILLPSSAVTLTGSLGGSMTVDTFTASPGPTNVTSDTNPPATPFSVGATLHVGPNQRDGSYSGVFTVTVARQ